MAFHPVQWLMKRLYGEADLGAGRIDAAMDRMRAVVQRATEASSRSAAASEKATEAGARLENTIAEIESAPDKWGTLIHNMNQSRMRAVAREGNGNGA